MGRYEGKKKVSTSSPLYLGGVSDGYTILAQNLKSSEKFEGCLGDVSLNNK